MKYKPFLLTFSIVAPLALLPLVVSCGQSASNDNSDYQDPSIKYTQTTTKGGSIDIKQALNLDVNIIKKRQEACDYLINNKKWVIDYKDAIFSGETQFLTNEDQVELIEATEDNSSPSRILVTIKVKPNSVIDASGSKNTTTTTFTFNNFYYYVENLS